MPVSLYVENVRDHLWLLAVKARDRHRDTPRRTTSPKHEIATHDSQRITPSANHSARRNA
jgi:hypothetical protein